MTKTRAIVACFILVAACAAPQESAVPEVEQPSTSEADVEAINGVADGTEEALNTGDAAAYAAFFADDAVSMLPNRPAIEGKEAISQAIQTAMASNTYQLSLSTDEIEVSGDWAFWRGSYSVTVTPAEGEPIEDAGKALNILQRQSDGAWKIARHIRNSDLAVPGMGGQ